eukprot:gene15964-7296_t
MKICNDLVFDRMSGQLIGYVDLGDPFIDFVSFEDNTQFAQYALVFMIRGLCTSLKAVFSYHLTGSSGSKAFQLWPLFWDAVFTLELVLNLKIGPDHIHVTPYGKMRVSFAVQVLSKSMALALRHYWKDDGEETANLCLMVNDLFDMCNVRSTTEHMRKRNPKIKPYTPVDDERLVWITNVFLEYLKRWKENIEKRPGEYSKGGESKNVHLKANI